LDLFQTVLIIATFLCSLTAGFLLAFAIVVMPGIRNHSDKEFIRTFQVIDRIIQNRQPVFILIWVGSIIALIISAALGIGKLTGIGLILLMLALFVYLAGVHIPTIIINIPLNNKLQTLDVDTMTKETLKEARENFEPRWNRWNSFRTIISCSTSLLLIILLFSIDK
jgi:uncharacterized membrane protein